MAHPATIRTILNVKKHPNADTLDLLTVSGWQCVSKTGNFKTGDKCVYIEIDSVCPDEPMFKFLEDKKFRVKTVRLRGEISQGLCLPLSDFPAIADKEVGTDVSQELNIVHYEKPVPLQMAGETKGNFPSFISKTDEELLQNYPELLNELKGNAYYITGKADGTSGTYYFNNGEFGACSRNWEKKRNEDNLYWKMAIKYNLEEKMKVYGKNIAIQAEIVGPGIQKNRLGLSELKLLVFDVFDIDAQKYMDADYMNKICEDLQLEKVTMLECDNNFHYTLEELLEKAKGNYENTNTKREGIVVRPILSTYSEVLHGRLSFKVLNNDYKED